MFKLESFFLALLTIFLSCATSMAASITEVNCTPNDGLINCSIKIKGSIEGDDVLFLDEVADIDRTYFNSTELGRTGYFFGTQYYAKFIPRSYSLSPLANEKNPTIISKVVSLTGIEGGIHLKNVHILKPAQAFFRTLVILIPKFFLTAVALLAFSAFFLLKQFDIDHKSILDRRWLLYETAFIVSTFGFVLSMAKIPRILTPTILPISALFKFHGLVEAIMICTMNMLLISPDIDKKRNRNIFSSMEILIFILFILFFGAITFSSNSSFSATHKYAVFFQTIALVATLTYQCITTKFRDLAKYHSLGTKLFFAALAISSVVLLRDATTYFFYHGPGTNYYIQYLVCVSIVTLVYRLVEERRIDYGAAVLSESCRNEVAKIRGGIERLNKLCDILVQAWNLDRVSVLSVEEDTIIVLTSRGPNPAKLRTTNKLTPLVKGIIDKKRSVFFTADDKEVIEKLGLHYKNACFLVPIIQGARVVAILTLMTRTGIPLNSTREKFIKRSSTTLNLEVLSAYEHAITEKQLETIERFTRSTNGVVLEHLKSFAVSNQKIEPFRRMIVTADRVKSTYIDQVGWESDLLWKSYEAYKRDVYTYWMAIKEVLEMESKDVRGDDFWLITPKKFNDPKLSAIGEEKVAIICGVLLEESCRKVSSLPKYRLLDISGAHVAVCADEITILSLGIESAVCFDIHSRSMSRIQRIRGDADPGSVLVDVRDGALAKAADSSLFYASNGFYQLNETSFPDLHSLPDLMTVTGLRDRSSINWILEKIDSLVESSPYKDLIA